MLVCTGVLVLRFMDPDRPRPFRVPGGWPGVIFVSVAGAFACFYVMTNLPGVTWKRFGIWLVIGLVLYVAYGFRNSKVRASLAPPAA